MKTPTSIAVATLLLLIALPTADAAVPGEMVVQGRVTDSTGVPLPAGDKVFGFVIYDAETDGTMLWGESQTLTTGADGLWIARIGKVTPITPAVLDGSVRWLEIYVEVDPDPAVFLPRVPLVSNAYAIRVGTIDGATGGVVTGSVIIGSQNSAVGLDVFVAGYNNEVNGNRTTVAGGLLNRALGQYAFIGGGSDNRAEGEGAVVNGGHDNEAVVVDAAIGGGRGNYAVGEASVIAGGSNNTTLGAGATVGGGELNHAEGTDATVGGGNSNIASVLGSSVGGGIENVADGEGAVVAGGKYNVAGSFDAAITGGRYNEASDAAFVGGGLSNDAIGVQSCVVGGHGNTAAAIGASVGGGFWNRARGEYSVVCGGGGFEYSDSNLALGNMSFVGGGSYNYATGAQASIVGGEDNLASGQLSAVSGGLSNRAVELYSSVPGGYNNLANDTGSMAAGTFAICSHPHTFVWGDGRSDVEEATSSAPNQFLIRASNGVRFSRQAGEDKAIEMGDHYRDNGIVAWGRVRADGNVSTYEFGVAGVVRNSTGNYTVTLDITASSTNNLIVTATPEIDTAPSTAATLRIVSVNQVSAGLFDVYINTGAGVAVDNDFMFMVTAR